MTLAVSIILFASLPPQPDASLFKTSLPKLHIRIDTDGTADRYAGRIACHVGVSSAGFKGEISHTNDRRPGLHTSLPDISTLSECNATPINGCCGTIVRLTCIVNSLNAQS